VKRAAASWTSLVGSLARRTLLALREWTPVPASTLLAGCAGGVMDPQGPVGRADRQIILNALAIMLVIVVPTIATALAFAWWYREGNARARRKPDFVYSGRLELLVWSIPLLTILFLSGVIWVGSQQLDPARPLESDARPVEVQVVSLDWKWLFIYPQEHVATVNDLVVPSGVPVHFSLTSSSVMNMFFVPQLGSMIATMNGMVTQLHLQADHPGDYLGLSAQFSGDGFSDMTFTLRAVPPDRYAAWLGEVRANPATLDRAAYTALLVQGSPARPTGYGRLEPGLFDAVAKGRLPPGPGPQAGSGGPGVKPQPES
jgi:cytochrome o ubiquinol oxidase subunit II